MDRDTVRQLVFIAIFSSFASRAAGQAQPSPAPTPDPTAPLREEVQRLQKEVDSLEARLRECSSSAPAPAALPTALEIAEFRYQEALAAVKAIEQVIGDPYSKFHRRYIEAKVKMDGLSGSGPREEGLRKVMQIFEKADYKMSLGSGNPSSYGMQAGIELCVRAQAALASLVAAQPKTAAPTQTTH